MTSNMAIRSLATDLQERARRELNEEPERLEQDLKHITDWLSKQPHLHARTDPQWLTTFLRGCKFSLERTKSKMDMYYTLRTALPEFFTHRDPMSPEIQHILKLGVMLPLPLPDDEGRRVILIRNGLQDPDKVKLVDIFKVNMMVIDTLLAEDDRTVVSGTVTLMDHSKATFAHFTQFSPFLVKRAVTLFQDGYPSRPKGIHHANTNSAFAAVFNMIKSFMREKLRNRLFIHASMDTVYEHVPKRILPLEYGGDAGPIDKIADKWKNKIESRRPWFLEDEKYRVDEKKRPGKPKTYEDLFGLEGSFRQLNVD